jgi:PPK2 family polyphosphate:nucleotide phosphotransferase
MRFIANRPDENRDFVACPAAFLDSSLALPLSAHRDGKPPRHSSSIGAGFGWSRIVTEERYLKKVLVPPGAIVRVKDYDTHWALSKKLKDQGEEAIKKRAERALADSRERLTRAQQLLYADDRYSLLIVLQAMDAAGKDGTIRHVMSGLNPQGCQVFSFKQPSSEELDHNFLWRCMKSLPERGRIGIFNRSYYEEVLAVKVHKEWLERQRLPIRRYDAKFWQQRYADINAFERHLVRNGTVILKFFLNISKREQKQRFLERLDNPKKYWKFSTADLAERKHWNDYMHAYGEAFSATSTKWAPWHIIPADYKWAARSLIADIIANTIESLDLRYPKVTKAEHKELLKARRQIERE